MIDDLLNLVTTEAAAALDLTDLPEGTAIVWVTGKPWDRGVNRYVGVIERVTPKTYLVTTIATGRSFTLFRDPDSLRAHALSALRTPEEEAERKRQAIAKSRGEGPDGVDDVDGQ